MSGPCLGSAPHQASGNPGAGTEQRPPGSCLHPEGWGVARTVQLPGPWPDESTRARGTPGGWVFERAGVLGQTQGGGAWCPDGICAGNSIQMPVSYSREPCHLALTTPTALLRAVLGVTWTASHSQRAGGGAWHCRGQGPPRGPGWGAQHSGAPAVGGGSRPGDSRRAEALPSAQLQAELLLALTQTGLGQWRACR